MKKLVVFCLCLCTFIEGFSQEKNPQSKDTLQPAEKIQVNKIYDEQGRLIRYDSIYSHSYSSSGKMNDSLKAVFETYLKNNQVFKEGFFDEFFKDDSLTGSFHPNAFLSQGVKTEQKEIKNIMMQVDSLRLLFSEKRKKSQIKDTLKSAN